eukprot:TRINITY_DN4485_c0_g2_i3.p1 TRINITY_DN4485_c0_g2~~TRINITY_DN4485_c0_g2_i3.p1  ORF type:complete len:547 (+),score=43.04 TRINITY_DN4485_c0_g2_i3:235-1641(+)
MQYLESTCSQDPNSMQHKNNNIFYWLLIIPFVLVFVGLYTLKTRYFDERKYSKQLLQDDEHNEELDRLVKHLAQQLNKIGQVGFSSQGDQTSVQNGNDQQEQSSGLLSFGEQTQMQMQTGFLQTQSNLPPHDSAFDRNIFNMLKLPDNIPQIDFQKELSELIRIGAGGFATVYEAKYRTQKVAVKVVSPQFCSDNQLRAILQEIDNMSRLEQHPNVVGFIGASLAPQPSIVMELVPNGTLQQVLDTDFSSSLISYATQVQIFKGIASGLAYLHSLNIIHRDLKPSNVLIMDKEKFIVKIADFGLSRVNLEAATLVTATFGGTVHYMAPEAFTDRRVSNKVDIWALGCIMQYVVRGVRPWKDGDRAYVTHQVANRRQPPDGGSLPDSCPKELKRIIRSCWSVDPRKRPTSKTIVDQLDGLLNPKSSSLCMIANSLSGIFSLLKIQSRFKGNADSFISGQVELEEMLPLL